MNTPKIRVFCICQMDAYSNPIEAIQKHLSDAEDIEFLGYAETGQEGIRQVQELMPDIVLVDGGVTDMSPAEIEAQFRNQQTKAIRIVMIATFETLLIGECKRLGLWDFLYKPIRQESLLTMLRGIQSKRGHEREYKGRVFCICDDWSDGKTVRDIESALADEPDFEFVGFAEMGYEGVEQVKRLKPDFVLIDSSLPDMGAIEILNRIRQFDIHTACLVMTFSLSADWMQKCFNAGIQDFIDKPIHKESLLASLRLLRGYLQNKGHYD